MLPVASIPVPVSPLRDAIEFCPSARVFTATVNHKVIAEQATIQVLAS
jgi:hypothetical protein